VLLAVARAFLDGDAIHRFATRGLVTVLERQRLAQEARMQLIGFGLRFVLLR